MCRQFGRVIILNIIAKALVNLAAWEYVIQIASGVPGSIYFVGTLDSTIAIPGSVTSEGKVNFSQAITANKWVTCCINYIQNNPS